MMLFQGSGHTVRQKPKSRQSLEESDHGLPEDSHPVGEIVLEVQGLQRNFGGVAAVDGVSFAVRRGTITGIIGPNGAGKSTVLALISGSLPAGKGVVTLNGRTITGYPPDRVAKSGMVRTFQLSSEFAGLTVLENLLMGAVIQKGEHFANAVLWPRSWRAEEERLVARARAVLDRFNLAELEDAYAGELSGGQKRLVEIMRAIMAEPEVLLLDEPMAGINPGLVKTVEAMLLELQQSRMTILMIEHELGVVGRICDPVIVMAQGRVLREGSMDELRNDPEVRKAYLVG